MPQTWAQRSQATKDRKNANVVSFSYFKFAFYLIISCFLINLLSLFVIANFHASQKIAQRENYAAMDPAMKKLKREANLKAKMVGALHFRFTN